MKKVDIPELKSSMYKYENYFNVYEQEDGKRFFNILRNLSIFPATNSQVEEEYIVRSQDTWYSIAYHYYGSVNLWWIVCLYNQVINPLAPLNPDTNLKLLKTEYVGLVLSELQKQIR
jgi:hypothetical protein